MAYGAASFRLGEWDNALDGYLHVLTLDINIPEVYVRIIQCYTAKGNVDAAKDFLEILLDTIPESHENKDWTDLAKTVVTKGG